MKKWIELLTSRKTLIAIAAIAASIAAKIGWQVDSEVILGGMIAVAAWIGGIAHEDAAKIRKGKE